MRIPDPGEIESRRAALLQKIADAREQLSQLDEWVKITAALFPAIKADVGVSEIRERSKFSPLVPYAETVLRSAEKLHINELILRMIDLGWTSTGDRKRDLKNVYSCLSGNRRFTNLGRNVWTLTKEMAPASSTEEW